MSYLKVHIQKEQFHNAQDVKDLGTQKTAAKGFHTTESPRKVRDDQVKFLNCEKNHPTNYRNCIVYKQLQQKLYLQL